MKPAGEHRLVLDAHDKCSKGVIGLGLARIPHPLHVLVNALHCLKDEPETSKMIPRIAHSNSPNQRTRLSNHADVHQNESGFIRSSLEPPNQVQVFQAKV